MRLGGAGAGLPLLGPLLNCTTVDLLLKIIQINQQCMAKVRLAVKQSTFQTQLHSQPN